MAEEKVEQRIITCPNCEGRGIKNNAKCPQCHGRAVMFWTGKQLLYWGKRIDKSTIHQDNIKNAVKFIIDSILLFIAAVGLILLFREFLFLGQQGINIYEFYKVPSWSILFFWLSLISDGYLFFRLQKDYESNQNYIKRKHETQPLIHHVIDWNFAKELSADYKVDVSKMLSVPAMSAVIKAWKQADKHHYSQVLPIHLFITISSFQEAKIIFGRLGLNYGQLKAKIIKVLNDINVPPSPSTVLSQPLLQIIFESYQQAFREKEKKVEIPDLLIGLTKIESPVKILLYDLEVDLDKMLNVATWIRVRRLLYQRWQRFRKRAQFKPKGSINRSMTAVATPMLDSFSQDMTRLAKYGYLSPCVGRKAEIKSIFRMIEGGTRRSVILVGNPGIGRRTIIQGIAQLMTEEDVPKILQDKRLVSISLAKLIGGASASLAQKRLMISLNEVIKSRNIILFIHDIQNMVGITTGMEEGSLDLATTLSQIATRSKLIIFATTTPRDYTKYIENSALGNLFEKLEVDEPHGNEAIQILEAKTGSIEYKNNVYFSYDAVEKAAELSDRYLHERFLPEKAIEVLEEAAIRIQREKGKDSVVTAEDVAQIITEKTKIPLTQITQKETDKLLKLEDVIHQRVIGQEEAVHMISTALRRARAGMREEKRPIANLLFLGPTGVGKTELAKTVAEVYFGSETNMIRLDMSEYQNQASIYRLIGSPVDQGGGRGGYLTEAVRKNPFSLLLLDEIEKAHPDLINIFLQVMDDGRLTDNTGRTIDFTNIVIIGTSNANSIFIQKRVREGASADSIKNELLEGSLQQHFRPEFLNRLDGVIVFRPLSIKEVEEIAKLQLKKLADKLEVKGIFLEVTTGAVKELAKEGFDPEYGARPLKRVIQEKVSDAITNLILENKVGRRDTIIYDLGGEIKINKAK